MCATQPEISSIGALHVLNREEDWNTNEEDPSAIL